MPVLSLIGSDTDQLWFDIAALLRVCLRDVEERIAWCADFKGALPFETGVLDTCRDALRVLEAVPFESAAEQIWHLIVRVEFQTGLPVTIALSVALVPDDRIETLLAPLGAVGLIRVRGKRPGVICDALAVPECCTANVQAIAQGRTYEVGDGELSAVPLPGLGTFVPGRNWNFQFEKSKGRTK